MLIRSLGQGSLALVSQHVINLWFIRRRGLTIGISGVGFAMGVAFLPSLIEIIINKYDWRMAYIILGLIVAATILPLGALLFRGHPESFGLEPDGVNEKPNKALETNYTAAEARKTGVFWLFTAATITTSMLATGLLFHNYNILAENGLNRDLATKVFIPIGFLAAAANLITGYLLDKIAPRYVLSVAMMLLVSTLVVATQINSLTGIYIYGALLGTMQGTAGAISSTVFAHHFGRRHLGAIKGLVTTLSVAGSALGPVLFSFGYDMFSSYSKVILFSALLPFAIAIAAPFIKPVNQRPSS
ncbi:MAG TPA: MFS transporter [Trueperaceae bacterium]|nr:MFS transporter [Trueperaceae bacterium]